MRTVLVAFLGLTILTGSAAFAGEPMDPYMDEPTPAAPRQPAPPPPVPVPPPTYLAPQYPYYPYRAPAYYYPPPAAYPPPAYYAPPPPRLPPPTYRPSVVARPPLPRARFVSFGPHATVLAIDQLINGQDVILVGGGLHLRFRSRGHFAMEGTVDFVHADFEAVGSRRIPLTDAPSFCSCGPVTRDSVPLSLTFMGYIFPNRDDRIFNLFFGGGIGAIPSAVTVTDNRGLSTRSEYAEWEAHLAAGLELRFHWLAIQADVRGLGLFRRDSDFWGYTGEEGGPIPRTSWGVRGTLGVSLWF